MRTEMESSTQSHSPTELNLTNDNFVGNETLIFELIRQYSSNKKIEEPYYSFLIVSYSLLIIIGSCGNVLVVLAVLRNKSMQTARWAFFGSKILILINGKVHVVWSGNEIFMDFNGIINFC